MNSEMVEARKRIGADVADHMEASESKHKMLLNMKLEESEGPQGEGRPKSNREVFWEVAVSTERCVLHEAAKVCVPTDAPFYWEKMGNTQKGMGKWADLGLWKRNNKSKI